MAPTVRDRLVREALLDGSPGTQTIRGVCPFCVRRGHHTKKKNLSLDRSTGRFFCFKCHTTDLLDGWEITEEYLLKKPPPEIPTFDPPPGWVRIGPQGTPTTLQARNYLLGRGIASRAIQEAKMGVSTEAPESREDLDFRNRAIVPILAADEETWLGYVGRDLRKKSTMPYLYCRGMMRGKILYNQAQVYVETDVPLRGVEGTLDTAFLWPDSAAFLGTWGRDQVEILKDLKRPFVSVLDGDAWRKGEALALTLRLFGIRAGHVRLPPCLDPDEIPESWMVEEIRRCLP